MIPRSSSLISGRVINSNFAPENGCQREMILCFVLGPFGRPIFRCEVAGFVSGGVTFTIRESNGMIYQSSQGTGPGRDLQKLITS